MATEQVVQEVRTRNERSSPRQLWQVPVFLLGVLAVAGVYQARPYWHDPEARQLERDLEEVRRGLDQRHPDLDELLFRAQRALDHIDRFPARTGEGHFLLGSALVRRAGVADSTASVQAWQQARLHLEEAERQGGPGIDLLKLSYRLGKAYAHLNAEPDKVITYLSRSGDAGADDPGERYALLAEAYLHLPTPDLVAALEKTQKQLALPAADDATLAPARLRSGEILLRLQRREEAHRALARIKPGAPPSILFRARYLQAKSYQEEGNWKEAARLWEDVKSAPEVAGEHGRILFDLGMCYRKDGRPAEAQRAWEEAAPNDPETKQAATLSLADLRARGDNPATSIELFDSALQNVETSTDYRNSLVSLGDARAILETACKSLRDAGDLEHFEHLAQSYTRIAEPRSGQQLLSEAAEALARRSSEQARKAGAADEKSRLEDSTRQHFQRAGAACEAVARAVHGQPEEADWLWRSAGCFFRGQEHQRTLDVLQRVVPLLEVKKSLSEDERKKLGEAWFLSGESHRALQRAPAALAAYQRCIAYPGPFAYPARYQLALADIDRGQHAAAEEHLEQILQLLSPAQDNDTREKTLFTLGELLFRRGEYTGAERRLQEALERYPASPSATKARSQLAESCRRLALDASKRGVGELTTPEARAQYSALRNKWLEMAAVNFQKLADDLAARRKTAALTKDEETLLRESGFLAAECRFDQGQYDEATRLHHALAERYHLQVEGLIALRNLWRCYGVKAQTAERDQAQFAAAARGTFERIATMLTQMPSAAFDNTSPDRTRQSWIEWLEKNRR